MPLKNSPVLSATWSPTARCKIASPPCSTVLIGVMPPSRTMVVFIYVAGCSEFTVTPDPPELIGEIDGEHDLRQLALRVGAGAVVAFGDHHIVEIDRVLAERGDVDDARGRARFQQGKQQMREQESGEVVDGEAQFVPVGAGAPLRAERPGSD